MKDKIQKNMLDILQQFSEGSGETALGEPQAYLELPHGRSLEITHEEAGLPEKDQYYSWMVHCSNQEFDDEKFHKTMGVIDKDISDDLSETTCIKMLEWAYRVAEINV